MQENVFLRDTNLPGIPSRDGSRLEIVASGLPVHRGIPLGVDATLVSPLHANGTPWPQAADTDGSAIARAEAKKRATYPELVHSDRLQLLTLACEVGGRWSNTCVKTIRALAAARARSEAPELRAVAARGWAARWWAMLSVAAQDTLASTLLDNSLATGQLDNCTVGNWTIGLMDNWTLGQLDKGQLDIWIIGHLNGWTIDS